MRLRIEIDVRKAIFPGFFLDRGELSPFWIQCKYEYVGIFFFSSAAYWVTKYKNVVRISGRLFLRLICRTLTCTESGCVLILTSNIVLIAWRQLWGKEKESGERKKKA
jgi:hypothetical protein